MPLALTMIPVDRQFEGCRSVMLVGCQVCPRMHFAWEEREPVFSPAMLLGKTHAFRQYLDQLRREAERRGLRSAVFKTPLTSAACLWATDLAERFHRAAAGYEAIGVIGCESAVRTISQIFPDKRIVQLARVEGIANFTLRSRWPMTLEIVAASQVPFAANPTPAGNAAQVYPFRPEFRPITKAKED